MQEASSKTALPYRSASVTETRRHTRGPKARRRSRRTQDQNNGVVPTRCPRRAPSGTRQRILTQKGGLQMSLHYATKNRNRRLAFRPALFCFCCLAMPFLSGRLYADDENPRIKLSTALGVEAEVSVEKLALEDDCRPTLLMCIGTQTFCPCEWPTASTCHCRSRWCALSPPNRESMSSR